jgi:septal ring factor EnvC (AmiA/AmiB activator)
MIASLQATLKRLGAEWEKQVAVVRDIDEPRRKLTEIEAQIAETRRAKEQADARIAQATAELEDCRRWLERWEPHAAGIATAAALLETIEDGVDFSVFNATRHEVNRTKTALATYAEIAIPARKAENQCLEKELRDLGVKP